MKTVYTALGPVVIENESLREAQEAVACIESLLERPNWRVSIGIPLDREERAQILVELCPLTEGSYGIVAYLSVTDQVMGEDYRVIDTHLLSALDEEDRKARFSDKFLEGCLHPGEYVSDIEEISPEHEKDFAVWLYAAARTKLSEEGYVAGSREYKQYKAIMKSARKTLLEKPQERTLKELLTGEVTAPKAMTFS